MPKIENISVLSGDVECLKLIAFIDNLLLRVNICIRWQRMNIPKIDNIFKYGQVDLKKYFEHISGVKLLNQINVNIDPELKIFFGFLRVLFCTHLLLNLLNFNE